MEKKKISFVSVFVVVVMLAAIFMPIGRVMSSGGQQHNIWGIAEDGPDQGSTGLTYGGVITAWIDGVSYGTNTTSLVNATFDLYVDGDEWGIPADDAVKNGGYDGDLIYYFLNYDPMDYYLDISDTTSTFDPSAYQQMVPNMFFDDQTESDIGIPGDTYLRGLKINEVVINPSSGNQYVYLYDPGGELSEAALEDATHGYYLRKDDNVSHDPDGPFFDFAAHTGNVHKVDIPIPTDYYYIELAGFTLNQADELKLVWKNPPNWGGSPTNNNIANGTDVIVDRVEWGNYVNYISKTNPPDDRDYDNTTLGDCPGITSSGQSYYRRPLNGTDTDDCSADFQVETATPPYAPSPLDTPGAPIGLTVHKGPYLGKGTLNDLVLYWKAPSWKWDKLVANIVYYDTDLSNGFQYTNWYEFARNSTTSAGDDWCVIPGFLADSNNYALIVHTTGDTKGSYENMTGSNIGYKYGINLVKNPATTSQMFVSIPYLCDWTWASDVSGPGTEFLDGSIITAVLKWNYSTQAFDARTWWGPPFNQWVDDFPINPGDALAVGIITTTPYLWKIVGSYDDTFEFTLLKNPSGTSQMFTSIPYHKLYDAANEVSGLGTEFTDGSIITAVLQWNYAGQRFDSRTWWGPPFNQWVGEFNLNLPPGCHLAFGIETTIPYPWKPQVIAL
jgi:hypothetical protein